MALIYTGPTNKTLGLRHNAIYAGDKLPAHLEDLAASNPALAHQFVPLARYAKTPRTPEKGPVSKVAARASRPSPRKPGPPIKNS